MGREERRAISGGNSLVVVGWQHTFNEWLLSALDMLMLDEVRAEE